MFNPGQQALIDAPFTTPVVGVAGAGTGKTTTILARATKILKETKTGNLLLITFTRAAANELRDRLFSDPDVDERRVMVGTFHSVIGTFIRKHALEIGLAPNVSVIDEASTTTMFRRIIESNGIYQDFLLEWLDEKKLTKKCYTRAASAVSVLLNLASPDELMTGKFSEHTLYRMGKAFTADKLANGMEKLSDFAYKLFKDSLLEGKNTNVITYDQILFIGWLLKQNDSLKAERESFMHTIVDEYQDTNPLQDAFITWFAGDNLTIVGDVDQSIYEFRGGTPELIIEHAKKAQIFNLTDNYRSLPPILTTANAVIKGNQTGSNIRKDLTPIRNGIGVTPVLHVSDSDWDESRQIVKTIQDGHANGRDYREFAVLIRSRMSLPSISRALAEAKIPVYDTTKYADFMKSEVMTDTLNFLKVFVNPKDIYAFLSIIDRPKQGIGPAALEKLEAAAKAENLPLIEFLLSPKVSKLTPALKKKVDKFITAYSSVTKSGSATAIPLLTLVKYLHQEFGYEAWLMSLKNADRYGRDLTTLYSLIGEFEKEQGGEGVSLYDLANAFVFDMTTTAVRQEQKDGVCITTIHNAKGLEWPHVFLLGLEEENFPGRVKDQEDLESERRLFYVGVTRAKDRLDLYAAKHRLTSGTEEMHPSRFVMEAAKTIQLEKVTR